MVRALELRKHIRRSDDLQVDIIWNDYFGEPPTLSFEVLSFHPCLLLVVEPPICFLDIRKQEGLESWLKCFSPICEDLSSASFTMIQAGGTDLSFDLTPYFWFITNDALYSPPGAVPHFLSTVDGPTTKSFSSCSAFFSESFTLGGS